MNSGNDFVHSLYLDRSDQDFQQFIGTDPVHQLNLQLSDSVLRIVFVGQDPEFFRMG